MNDHIPDATKMISDTPRMHSALMDAPDAGFAKIWQVGCDIELELNEANAIIRQQQLLEEENLRLQERIKLLESVTNNPHALWANWLRGSVTLPVGIGDVRQYQERIKRLEEAGNNLLWNFCPEYTSDLTQEQSDALKQWNKAKEAKPCIKQLKTKSCIYCMKVECECSDFDVSADMGAKG